ncbi:ATPase [Pseudohoeflea suaedae]|uniref:ATPase n=1 Tax=Pseudohoeflea suaedae TaxID=877384 RepID=A0A4R5PKB0_9HYPH|nr:ATP12 family protein [Pseudohoeflea suaedae]TDH36147.1 ATPase [Pseudohoeflea suaedae]
MRDLLSDLEDGTPQEKDPVRRAQSAFQRDMPKRFYKDVTVGEAPDGFLILLDGRELKTPSRGLFHLPSRDLADAVAEEWDAQTTRIDPGAMPLTRILNTALDGVVHVKDEVRQEILAYGGTDLLCYRADSPEGLVAAQNKKWNPFLAWMEQTHGARFQLAEGVMHVEQSEETRSILAGLVAARDSAIVLAALHVATSLTGSLVMPLAILEGAAEPDEVWSATHVDEDWNISQWGEDAEATRRRNARRHEFDMACLAMRSIAR